MIKNREDQQALSERETQVLRLLADGYTNDEVAQLLMVSRRTVEAHRGRIMLKLRIHDLAGLVKYALRNKLTSLEDHRRDPNQLSMHGGPSI